MIPSDTLGWGIARNCIREVYEYGLRLKAEIGEDKVYDFSLGNPSVPAPPQVREAILRALEDPTLHDYTVAPGRPGLPRPSGRGIWAPEPRSLPSRLLSHSVAYMWGGGHSVAYMWGGGAAATACARRKAGGNLRWAGFRFDPVADVTTL